MYLKGFITNLGKYNEGELIGEWIEFPIDEDDLEEVLKRIGIDGENYEEYFFTDYDTDIELNLQISEYEDIDNLNEFGELLQNIESYQEDLVNAIVYEYDSFDYILEQLQNIDDKELIDVDNDEDLGYYIIDNIYGGVEQLDKDTLERYFDYEAYGSDIAYDYSKTPYGYLYIR